MIISENNYLMTTYFRFLHPGRPDGQGSARAGAGPARGAAPGTSLSEQGPQGYCGQAIPDARAPRLRSPRARRTNPGGGPGAAR